jgi:uncharacterized membrane protein
MAEGRAPTLHNDTDVPVLATCVLAVASALALIALGLAWELALAPTGARTLALKVVPLLLPIAGLLKLRLYTYRWTSLLAWLYFGEGAMRAVSGRGAEALLAAAEAGLSLLLFCACAAQVWWRFRRARKHA